jgi:hypothetical protein
LHILRVHHGRASIIFQALPDGTRKIGVDAAEAGGRLRYELDALGAQLVIGGATIVDDKHKGRHGALRYHFAHRMRRCRVEHGLLRQEQAKLERGLIRMLHREPAIVPVELEAQLALVEGNADEEV